LGLGVELIFGVDGAGWRLLGEKNVGVHIVPCGYLEDSAAL